MKIYTLLLYIEARTSLQLSTPQIKEALYLLYIIFTPNFVRGCTVKVPNKN